MPKHEMAAARALWKAGELLKDTARDMKSELNATEYFERATKARLHGLKQKDGRKAEELVEKEWDDMIYYYSR